MMGGGSSWGAAGGSCRCAVLRCAVPWARRAAGGGGWGLEGTPGDVPKGIESGGLLYKNRLLELSVAIK